MTTDIHDWKGTELLNDFIDYVNTGTANAKAIASQDTKSMIGSVRIDKIPNGYYVYSSAYILKQLSGKDDFYTDTYVNKGYKHYPAFDFFYEGFMALDDNDSIHNGYAWTAKGGRNRRGSGRATINGIKIPERLRK